MRALRRIRQRIIAWIKRNRPKIKRIIIRSARVVEQVTQGQVIVTKDEQIALNEPTTVSVTRRIASVAVAVVGFALLFVPTEFKFAMEIGDRLIRLSTFMWEGQEWTVST